MDKTVTVGKDQYYDMIREKQRIERENIALTRNCEQLRAQLAKRDEELAVARSRRDRYRGALLAVRQQVAAGDSPAAICAAIDTAVSHARPRPALEPAPAAV